MAGTKLVIVGASGNVGTAVLRALQDQAGDGAPGFGEVIGLARRVPRRTPPPPYDIATWERVDVGGRDGAAVVETLATAMQGADAVIQLAWQIQPNHDRERLRRTNVLGTARVLEATSRAGVPHLVIASSVGAYAPVHDDILHDESWPVTGIPTSEYSVDKADVEVLLDRHEREHPELLITRLRPAQIFQRDAGSQMVRYFIGPLVPPAVLAGRVPVLTWPRDVRIQALHADDVARAYLAAVRLRPGGAINLAADDVLSGAQISSVLSGGRWREVPVPAVRAAVSAAWNARAIPVSPGWVDLASSTALVSTERARQVLEWKPTRTALDTVREVVQGIVDGAGTASAPLRRR